MNDIYTPPESDLNVAAGGHRDFKLWDTTINCFWVGVFGKNTGTGSTNSVKTVEAGGTLVNLQPLGNCRLL